MFESISQTQRKTI